MFCKYTVMNTLYRKRICFFAAVVPVVVLLSLYGRAPASPTTKHIRSLERAWKSGKYLPIDSSAAFAEALAAVTIEGERQLSPERIEALRNAVNRWLNTYRTGTYEAYCSFRRAAPHVVDLNPLQDKLRTFPGIFKVTFPEDTEGKLKVLWELSTTMKFTTINPSSVEIRAGQQADPEGPLQRSGARFYAKNICYLDSTSPFRYHTTPDSIIEKEGTLAYFTISLVVGIDREHEIYPVQASFYWSESDRRWLPWEMSMGYLTAVNELQRSVFF